MRAKPYDNMNLKITTRTDNTKMKNNSMKMY